MVMRFVGKLQSESGSMPSIGMVCFVSVKQMNWGFVLLPNPEFYNHIDHFAICFGQNFQTICVKAAERRLWPS